MVNYLIQNNKYKKTTNTSRVGTKWKKIVTLIWNKNLSFSSTTKAKVKCIYIYRERDKGEWRTKEQDREERGEIGKERRKVSKIMEKEERC